MGIYNAAAVEKLLGCIEQECRFCDTMQYLKNSMHCGTISTENKFDEKSSSSISNMAKQKNRF